MGAIGEISRRVLPHPLHRLVRRRRVGRAIRQFDPRIHRGTYGGHELELQLRDPLAAGWYGHDWPVLPEIELLKESLPGATVFDLGAHQALVALILAMEVGETGTVLAVEAEPHNAAVAEENTRLNGAPGLTILNASVAEARGEVPFAEGLNGAVDPSTRMGNVMVPAVTIDELAESYGMPDVVFIDIEGYEGQALRAADRVLASGAAFFVEVHTDRLVGMNAEEIVGLFDGRERLIAEDPGGDKATHQFVPFDGAIPSERFYLLAR